MLVDDKKLDQSVRESLEDEVLRRVHGLGIDYVCFETRLTDALPALRRILPDRIWKSLERRRRGPSGRLTCDQDILLWYALRLGLADKALCGVSANTAGATNQGRPFEANRLVSFLDVQFAESERKAQVLINRAFGPEIASACSPIFTGVAEEAFTRSS